MTKNLYTFLLLTISALFAHGQPVTFEIDIATPYSEIVGAAYEVSSKYYFLGGSRDREIPPTNHFDLLLVRIDQLGDTLIKTHQLDDTSSVIMEILPYNFDLVGIGAFDLSDPKTGGLLYVLFDSNLNIKSVKKYQTPPPYTSFYNRNVLRNRDGNMFIIGEANDIYIELIYEPGDLCIYELTDSGDTLRSKYFQLPGRQHTVSACFNNDSTEIFVFGSGFQSGVNQRVTVDLDLNIVAIDTFFYKLRTPYEVQNYNEGYITCSEFTTHNPYQDDDVWVFKTDSTFAIADEIELITQDTLDGPAYNNPLDFIDSNKIFVGVLHDVYLGFSPNRPSWVMLYRLNSDLETEMCRYYGGDEYYYSIYAVKATSDGGVLLLCTKYNYNQDFHINNDIYILKVNEDGLLTDIVSHKINDGKNKVYPNPGANVLIIETDYQSSNLLIFNLSGQEVFNSKLIEGKNIIGTKHWPNGLYLYSIINNDKKIIETGKWIKQ